MGPLLTVAAVVAVLLALDRLCLWMESRGLIYWRRSRPDPRGAVLGVVDEVVNPAHVHVVEQRRTEALLIDVQTDAGPSRLPAPSSREGREGDEGRACRGNAGNAGSAVARRCDG